MKAVIRTIVQVNPGDAIPRTCAEVVIIQGKAVVQGEEWVRSMLETEDIGIEYTLDDGELFIQSLPKALRSPYLNAKVVDE